MTADDASASLRELERRVRALIAEADVVLGRCAELDDADAMEADAVRRDVLLLRQEAVQAEDGLDRLAETGREVAPRAASVRRQRRAELSDPPHASRSQNAAEQRRRHDLRFQCAVYELLRSARPATASPPGPGLSEHRSSTARSRAGSMPSAWEGA